MRSFLIALPFLLISFPTLASLLPQKIPEPKSIAEDSGWIKTGRYEEVERIGRALQKEYPASVRLSSFGQTPEGRPLWAIVLAADKGFTSSSAKRPGREAVLIQGGIHAGEIDGKDASFFVMREILAGRMLPGVLKKLTLIFVPVFNADGHERFKTNNRPNQIGPEEMGWRTTSQNYNLNRDYLKAEAPEMQAKLRLMNEWDPILFIDLHVTNGAKFQHDIAVIVEPARLGPPALQKAARDLSDHAMSELKREGHLPLWFYPAFIETDQPSSGFATGPQSPRFSNGYWGLRNRLGVLVETHAWRTYKERVHSTINSLRAMLALAQTSAPQWRAAAREAEAAHRSLAGQSVVLRYKNSDKPDAIPFEGYAYSRTASAISGQTLISYDTSIKKSYQLPLFFELQPSLSLEAPRGGYLIPPAYRSLWEAKLKLHAIAYQVVPKPVSLKGEEFRMESVELSDQSYEGRQRATVKGAWQPRSIATAAGSLWVPIAQPGAMTLLQLIEPLSPESLLAWGFMNQIFERKEYMEDYVAEEVARQMLLDPKIKAAFEEKLKDSRFAASPEERLDFFYQRHPSFDERWNTYPIARLERAP